MKHKPLITDPESTELKNRASSYYVLQVPPYNLTSYELDPYEEKILSVLWYETFMGKDTVKLTYKEYAAFLNYDRRKVSSSFKVLKKKGIISIEEDKVPTKKKGLFPKKGLLVKVLIPLLSESDKVLYEEDLKRQERYKASSPTLEENEEPLEDTSEDTLEEVQDKEEVNSKLIVDPTTGELITDKSKAVYNGFQI